MIGEVGSSPCSIVECCTNCEKSSPQHNGDFCGNSRRIPPSANRSRRLHCSMRETFSSSMSAMSTSWSWSHQAKKRVSPTSQVCDHHLCHTNHYDSVISLTYVLGPVPERTSKLYPAVQSHQTRTSAVPRFRAQDVAWHTIHYR